MVMKGGGQALVLVITKVLYPSYVCFSFDVFGG